jgi:L-fuculose-phosphate aldolase
MEGLASYSRSITVSNEKLGEEFAEAMGEKPACLMRGHGITTAGAGVEEATLTAIKLNELAEVNYRASLLGNPQPIAQEDIDIILGPTRRQRSPTHSLSNWRYYCRLLGE